MGRTDLMLAPAHGPEKILECPTVYREKYTAGTLGAVTTIVVCRSPDHGHEAAATSVTKKAPEQDLVNRPM